MARDVAVGFLVSVLLHGFVLWYVARIRQSPPRPEPSGFVLNLYVARSSLSGASGSSQAGKPAVVHPAEPDRQPPVKVTPPSHLLPKRSEPISVRAKAEISRRPEETLRASPVNRQAKHRDPLPPPRIVTEPTEPALAAPKPADESLAQERIPRATSRLSEEKTKPIARASPGHETLAPPEALGKPSEPPVLRLPKGDTGAHEKGAVPVPGLSEPGTPPGAKEEAYSSDRGTGGSVTAKPDYALNPKPVYPKLAIRKGYEGTVTLLVDVLPNGSVGKVEVLASSGHAILDRSAVKTVRKWRFIPGKKGGRPVRMKVKVPIVFRLKEARRG